MPELKKFLSAVLGLAISAGTANADVVTDCPLRDAPFSESTPLIDILLSPAARATVEKELGVSFDQAPPQFLGTKAPTFAAILTLTEGAGLMRRPPEAIAKAAAALKSLPVTQADKVARCERYDSDKPSFILPEGKPAILVFEKITGFKDVPSFDAAHALLKELAEKNGWALVFSDKGGAMTPETLSRFDAVIWNNISGDVLTLSQRKAFRDYIEGGGGFVGIHGSGGDPVYFWDWYADTLIGARFAGHPRNPQFQEARVVVADSDHPAARDLPAEWRMTDEWYSFKTNPRDGGARIVARLDEKSYDPSAGFPIDLGMGEEHPIAWSRIVGKGRSFYSAIGHVPATYEQPQHKAMLEDAIAWAAGINNCDCND
ncbi:MAG: ThuA domain-containing protein [Novosphingobium sp.]|nr:ThuA domain-containing protein [Novosphingobium sp.]